MYIYIYVYMYIYKYIYAHTHTILFVMYGGLCYSILHMMWVKNAGDPTPGGVGELIPARKLNGWVAGWVAGIIFDD